jgi:hypothetical protein
MYSLLKDQKVQNTEVCSVLSILLWIYDSCVHFLVNGKK